MPVKDLLAGECGGGNPLLRASEHLTGKTGLDQRRELVGPHRGPSGDYVGDFPGRDVASSSSSSALQRENVFRMDSLLDDMQRIDREAFLQSQDARADGAICGIHKQWSQEYQPQEYLPQEYQPFQPSSSIVQPKYLPFEPSSSIVRPKWADEYLTSQNTEKATMSPPQTFHRPNLLTSQHFHHPLVSNSMTMNPLVSNSMTMNRFTANPMTMNRFMSSATPFAHQQLEQMYRARESTLAEEARRLVSNVKHDNELYSTEFLDFVDKIAQEKITLDSRQEKITLDSGQEKIILDSGQEKITLDSLDSKQEKITLDSEPASGSTVEKEESPVQEEKDDLEFWNYLANEWDQMAREESETYSWLNHEAVGDIYNEYFFTDENPLKETPNALEEGLKKLREGDIPSAVLLFEAACQQEPENGTAWRLLGTTQAKNEHDPAAIRAIKRSLQLEPNNLTSLMALAVSYTNESLQKQACDALYAWIKCNPAYADVAAQMTSSSEEPVLSGSVPSSPIVSSVATSVQFDQVKKAYIAAARKVPVNLDPDVQAGLGVLFNLSGEYEKAIDCFQAALQSRPEDALLWNRLGATLANGNRSEDAVASYRRALQISPGFIRARFNLGISCVNLAAHSEAVQHFLAVLNFQNAGRGPQGTSSRTIMSNNVWTSLRMALSLMNRQDLYDLVERKDLSSLNREFSMDTSLG